MKNYLMMLIQMAKYNPKMLALDCGIILALSSLYAILFYPLFSSLLICLSLALVFGISIDCICAYIYYRQKFRNYRKPKKDIDCEYSAESDEWEKF